MHRLLQLALVAATVLAFSAPARAGYGIPFRHGAHYARSFGRRHYGHRYHVYRRPHYHHRHSYFRSFVYRPHVWTFGFAPRYYYYRPFNYFYHRPLVSFWNSYCPPYPPYYLSTWQSFLASSPALRSPLPVVRSLVEPEIDRSVRMPAWRELVAVHRAMADRVSATAKSETPTTLTSWKATSSAERNEADHLEIGDQLFRGQFYEGALQQYEAAATLAPVMAAPYIRQGYALVALKRYQRAAEAFRRGMALDPTYLRSGFGSEELYGSDPSTRTEHVEAVAAAALEHSSDRDLLFVIGVLLQLEGESDRAKLFFQRARDPDPEPELVLD